MKPLYALIAAAPLTLGACDEFLEPDPVSVTEMQAICADELAERLFLTRADIRVTSTTATNRGTTGIVVEVSEGDESAYCEINATGEIVAFTRL